MSKITIREVDETTVGNVVIDSTDVAYIPGFSVLDKVDDSIIGEPHVPKLCRTITEFETYFGSSTPTFNTSQAYPSGVGGFNGLAIPTDIGGTPQYMFDKNDPDPSYIYAKELLAMGLPVLYERVNEIGENISVSKMYSVLDTLFDKTSETSVISVICQAPAFSSTVHYTAETDYCNYEGQNYICKYANYPENGESWNPDHWEAVNDYISYTVSVSSDYTFYQTFYDTGTYKFTYSKHPTRSLTFSSDLDARLALTYDSSKEYVVGDHCTYANNIFTCIKDTKGVFDTACWALTSSTGSNWTPSSFVKFNEDLWNQTYPVNNTDYVFTYDSTDSSWKRDSSAVDLASIGIIFNGVVNDGDEITVSNNYESGWMYNNKIYDLATCGINLTIESGRTLQYGDNFSIYLEISDPLLADRGLYTFKYLTTGGYPVFEYQSNSIGKRMANLCYTRGDAVALIDHTDNPARSLTGSTSVYYQVKDPVTMIPAAFQSFAAMFTPAVEMALINTYRGWSWDDEMRIKLPATCVLPASFAYLSCLANAIKIAPNWNAVAGATRGKVIGLVSPRTVKALTNAIADSYTPDTDTAINPITNIRPYGQCIWGNRTLVDNSIKQGTTATSFLNIRNLVSDVKKQLFVACQSLLFEQNTDVLWVNFLSLVTPVLDRMVSGFGIHNYKIIKLPNSDKTQINVRIRLYPVYAIESFDITIYLNDQGVYLDGEE